MKKSNKTVIVVIADGVNFLTNLEIWIFMATRYALLAHLNGGKNYEMKQGVTNGSQKVKYLTIQHVVGC